MVEALDVDLAAPSLQPTKSKMVKKVIGSLLVKSCVLLDPEGETKGSISPTDKFRCDTPREYTDKRYSVSALRRATHQHAQRVSRG